jgi:hypothetical protein
MQEEHVSISQFNNTLNFRTKVVHGQPLHLYKAARILLSIEHPRKMLAMHTVYIRNSSSGEYCWLGEQVSERIKITCHTCRVKEDLFWHSNLQIKKNCAFIPDRYTEFYTSL